MAAHNATMQNAPTKGIWKADRWARDLTHEARERSEAERNARIVQASARGDTQEEIARREGVAQSTVSEVLAKHRKRQPAETDIPPPTSNDAGASSEPESEPSPSRPPALPRPWARAIAQ